jgi:hypothetical protein
MKKRPFTVDELFPSLSPPVEVAGAETLQSLLIDAFESAIRDGMRPIDALAIIIAWASSELKRVSASQDNEPDSSTGA